MKPVANRTRHRKAFTIVELLTVMSIIVILIGLMIPALNQVKIYAMNVKQKAQFKSIEAALELFDSRFGSYPDSSYAPAGPSTGPTAYCGSLKLCEAMMGQDLMGYHPDSVLRSDGTDGLGRVLYTQATLGARPGGGFLPLENANAYPLSQIYQNVGPFDPCDFVLCDVYSRVTNTLTGKKIGMPILYYKANTSRQSHDLQNPDNPDNIYNWRDNRELLMLGKPWDTAAADPHRLLRFVPRKPGDPPAEPEGKRFYWNVRNDRVSIWRPYRVDSYILISAGWDGEYGTADDISNFEGRFQDSLP